MNRRAFLATVALGAGLAGCVSDSDDPADGDGDGSPSVGRTEIETTDAACAGGAGGEVTVERADGLVTISGIFTAPNPCHEAVIEGATVDRDTLQVSVGRQSTAGEGEVCQQCVGAISYEATVEVFPLDALEDVRVEHPDGSSDSTSEGS